MIQELTGIKSKVSQYADIVPILQQISNINVTIYRQGLKQCSEAWKNITSDHTILEAIQGMKIDFTEMPKSCMSSTRPTRFISSECEVTEGEIQKLLKKNIIRLCLHEEGEIISNIFLRPKRMGLTVLF